ncbi:MAG: DUF7718 family protein [Terrimicrobiaceae bacterium]
MPEKQFRVPLDEGFFVVAESRREGGRIVEFVVRLMGEMPDGILQNIARFDSAHGVPHLDILSRSGKQIEKIWFPGLDFDSVYGYALQEFKTNHAYYICRCEKTV